MSQLFWDHFRCPQEIASFAVGVSGRLSRESGYFRLGTDTICYGQYASGTPARSVTDALEDARAGIRLTSEHVELPFDPDQVVDNLRRERYCGAGSGHRVLPHKDLPRTLYYSIRPFLPVVIRRHLQRMYFRNWDKIRFPSWPVDETVEKIFEQLFFFAIKSRNFDKVPFVWFWPRGAKSCTMLTHDVETASGVGFVRQLMDLNDSFGIKSSFQMVPEKRYPVTATLLDGIRARGFEINVHDLNHDGYLTSNREEFRRSARRINGYGRQFGAQGFRSAVLYRNLDWYDALDFSYDMSVPNVAHLDPQSGGCCTVLPFFVGNILELPLTTTQDYTLFHILGEYSIRLWKEQISLIRARNGLISFNIHPDYIVPRAARRVYTDLLAHLCELRSRGETWMALPGEVAAWWRLRSQLRVEKAGSFWRIEGDGAEQARLAYAVPAGDTVRFELPSDQE